MSCVAEARVTCMGFERPDGSTVVLQLHCGFLNYIQRDQGRKIFKILKALAFFFLGGYCFSYWQIWVTRPCGELVQKGEEAGSNRG